MNDAEEQMRSEKLKLDEELNYITKDAIGRRFLWRLIHQECGIDASNFSTDALMQAYAIGRRDVGLSIKSALQNFDKQIYLKLEGENI